MRRGEQKRDAVKRRVIHTGRPCVCVRPLTADFFDESRESKKEKDENADEIFFKFTIVGGEIM